MAVIVWGKSRCVVCGKALLRSEPVILIPAAMYSDPESPLHRFHDAGVHEGCLDASDQGPTIRRDLHEYLSHEPGS